MKALFKLCSVEARLFFREPANWLVAVFLPTLLLVILGLIPGLRQPDPAFNGSSFIELFIPSLLVLTMSMLGVNLLPLRFSSDRARGILRRLSTTPVHPGALLAAQLLVNLAVALLSVLLLILVGWLGFGVALPRNPLSFGLTFVLGLASMFGLGLLIAATAPSERTAAALAVPLYILLMFLGGVYVPRFFLPQFLQRIGEFVPPGVQALLDSWSGAQPQPLQLLVLALIAVLASFAATRLFRWE